LKKKQQTFEIVDVLKVEFVEEKLLLLLVFCEVLAILFDVEDEIELVIEFDFDFVDVWGTVAVALVVPFFVVVVIDFVVVVVDFVVDFVVGLVVAFVVGFVDFVVGFNVVVVVVANNSQSPSAVNRESALHFVHRE